MTDNVADQESESKGGFFSRLKQGLGKTRNKISESLGNAFLGEKVIDDVLLEEIETTLLTADFGVEVTSQVVDNLTRRVARKELANGEALLANLKSELIDILKPCEKPLQIESTGQPFVILMVGVNGAGKTTTIGKLASRFKGEGKDVVLAAGDTFRAAAVDQLKVWGERNDIPVVAQGTGADSASVIFDAMSASASRGADILIADTAGRLQNKKNLMEELKKIVRVLSRQDETAPHAVLLALDAATGQNAISQAKEFLAAVNVSGLVLTKLDGSAKGGVVFPIAKQLGLPIHFVGVGEQLDDLREFRAEEFVTALLDLE